MAFDGTNASSDVVAKLKQSRAIAESQDKMAVNQMKDREGRYCTLSALLIPLTDARTDNGLNNAADRMLLDDELPPHIKAFVEANELPRVNAVCSLNNNSFGNKGVILDAFDKAIAYAKKGAV